MMRFTLKTLLTILLLGPMLAPMGVNASMGHHTSNMQDCLKYCIELLDQNAPEQGVIVKVSESGVIPDGQSIIVVQLWDRYLQKITAAHRNIGLILKTQKRE
ncbi:MAG: hypothetical protein HQ488_03680 [Parcubacteria group bacterium]|nr:hypothetical protein [Parcubacteria group bacterium]